MSADRNQVTDGYCVRCGWPRLFPNRSEPCAQHNSEPSGNPGELEQPERDWVEMVAHHAATHTRRGMSVEQAIKLGIADYARQLERLWDVASRRGLSYVSSDRATRFDQIAEHISARVHAEVGR